MTLKEMQQEVIENRRKRGWPSATELLRTTAGLAEETGEFEHARRKGDRPAMIDALADICVFALGAFEILGAEAQAEIEQVLLRNRDRVYANHH